VRKNPKVARGPNATSETRPPQMMITIGVRHDSCLAFTVGALMEVSGSPRGREDRDADYFPQTLVAQVPHPDDAWQLSHGGLESRETKCYM
jgi:hypothetical protein